jgi:hypothetical protein
MDQRPDPDDLLERVMRDEERQARGRLKIFFGFSAGVGKTFAMLEAAQALATYKWEILEARTGLWRLAIGKLPDGTKLVLGCDKEQPTWGVIRPLTTSYDDSEPEVRNPTVPAGGKLKMPPPAPRLLAK